MRKRILLMILFLIILGLISVLFLVLSHRKWLYIPCFFYRITGFYCPGCGMTRALYSFITFDFVSCFHNNLLLVFLIPAFLYYLFCFIKCYLLTGEVVSISDVFSKRLFLGTVILVIVFGFLRNFDIFSWMQPM